MLRAKIIQMRRLSLAVKINAAICITCLVYFSVKIFFTRENARTSLIPTFQNREQIASKADLRHIKKKQRPPVNCSLLFRNDTKERLKAINFQDANPKKAILESEYIARTQDCHKFIRENDYMTSPLPEEKVFPLAFSILIYKDIEQFERLLRAIYRPQNVYCVHVDQKSSSSLQLAAKSISSCFDNVFVLEINVNVIWGTYLVIKPDILCMEALLKYKKWKYFINLTGQEFPLKTNLELVQILKAINGSNLVEVTNKSPPEERSERFDGRPPPPINVTVYKGSVHAVVRREFVDFVINDENGRKYLNWLKLIGHASEYLFSTLNHNPQLKIPGSFLGIPESYDESSDNYPFINRYKLWKAGHELVCGGKFVRSICILGVGDLPLLSGTNYLFANKFHLDYHPLALDCLEELIYKKTVAELLNGRSDIDLSFYRNLQVARNHI